MNIGKFVPGIIVVVLGALMLADGVLASVADGTIFFEGMNPNFTMVVGIIALLLGGSLLEDGGKD